MENVINLYLRQWWSARYSTCVTAVYQYVASNSCVADAQTSIIGDVAGCRRVLTEHSSTTVAINRHQPHAHAAGFSLYTADVITASASPSIRRRRER